MITDKVKIKAKLSISDTDFDAVIDSLISGAIAFVERYISMPLDGDATVERVDLFDEPPIYPRVRPSEIVSLREWDGEKYVTVDSSRYRLLSDGSIDYDFSPGLDRVELRYKGAEQPEDLRELIERIVIRQFRKMEHEGESSTAYDTSTTAWADVLDDFDRRVLDNYRVWI